VSSAGYSGTPLARKLGLREGMRVAVLDGPAEYASLFPEGLPPLSFQDAGAAPLDVVHLFVTEAAGLPSRLTGLRGAIAPAGMIWVSWPKRVSGVPTDVTEDVVRRAALAAGLVDVKVCAVDAVWSGLKLVIRRRDRG
jgi:hypothetical protein